MSFNNALEHRKFEREWKNLQEQYREAGFSEEGINAMRVFDEEAYRSNRRYAEHYQELPSEDIDEDDCESKTNLFIKFESLSVSFGENDFTSRYAWIDTVSDPKLASRLKALKGNDLELLTLIVVDGYSQPEIACALGCSQQNISLKIIRIKKFLK